MELREKFEIQINHIQGFPTSVYMEPGKKVMEIAEKLSVAYPTATVHILMYARIRRTYMNGVVIASRPDFTTFYTNTTDEEKWAWSCYGQVTD